MRNRNLLKVKLDEPNMYTQEPPTKMPSLTREEIRQKNTCSKFDPIKVFEQKKLDHVPSVGEPKRLQASPKDQSRVKLQKYERMLSK